MMKPIINFAWRYRYLFLLGVILIFATYLRTIHLTTDPVGLNQDEAVNGYDAYSLGLTLRDHHGNFLPPMLQSFQDWVSPFLTYFTIPFVKFLGLSVKSIRLAVVVLGVSSIGLFYIFLRQIALSEEIALLGTFLLSIVPWHITLSRWAIPPSSVTFALLLFLVMFLWVYKKFHQAFWYILPAVAAALLTYSYPTQKLFVPLFVLSIVVIYLRKKLWSTLVLLISFSAMVSPIYILTYLQPEKYNAAFRGLSIAIQSDPLWYAFVTRYIEYFLPYFQFQAGDADIMHHVPGIGASYEILSLFFYVGIILCILGFLKKITVKNISQETYLLLLIWTVLFPVAASLTLSHNMLLRVVHGLPLVIIFFLITLQFVGQFLKKNIMYVFYSVICIIGLVNVHSFMQIYLYDYPSMSFNEFQYGIEDYSRYLLVHDNEFTSVVIDTSINQPYIYYLFYSKFDPKKLHYSNPSTSNPEYTFKDLSSLNTDGMQIIHTTSFGDTSLYTIYKSRSIWYVKKM